MVTLYRALLASCEVIAPRFATAACLKFRVSMRTNFYFSSIVKATFLFLSFLFLNLTKAFYRPLRPCLIDILQRFLSVPLKTFRVTFSLQEKICFVVAITLLRAMIQSTCFRDHTIILKIKFYIFDILFFRDST